VYIVNIQHCRVNVRLQECFACLLVLSKKRHTKNTGGEKVQFNELFYYDSLDKPSARLPHQISNTDKKQIFTVNVSLKFTNSNNLENCFDTFGIQINT